IPLASGFLGVLPFLWLLRRKKKRVRKFLDAMPEAVELISRALRAGHGLASGLHLVAEEMKGPIADGFGRGFEEQNLGSPLELALRGMADRIPVMDVRFFVIAVVIQRATGGDLAEVLDKIGRLIRQRFELQGHVRALTAEGRLSGVVLLALPPGLLAFLSFSNYNYISVLFTTPVGNKMLMITAGLQLVGAWMIKKIVAIKVESAMLLSWSTVVPLAAFFAITLGVWAMLSVIADRPINADERLKRVLNPNAARPDASALARQQDMLQAKFAEAAKRLGKSLKPS